MKRASSKMLEKIAKVLGRLCRWNSMWEYRSLNTHVSRKPVTGIRKIY